MFRPNKMKENIRSNCIILYKSFLFNLICNMTFFRKKCFDPSGGRGCIRIFACIVFSASLPFNLTCNMSRKTKKMNLNDQPGSRMCVRKKHLLACKCMLYSLQFDMQHDHVLKK